MGGTEANGKDASGPLWWGKGEYMHLEVIWNGPLDLEEPEVNKIPTCITGVYVIWAEDRDRMVYVGSGKIQECLLRHIQKEDDPVVQARISHLKAGYAAIYGEENYMGAENYLAYLYNPQIGSDYPNKPPREVVPYPFGKPFLQRTPYSYSPDVSFNKIHWLIYEPEFRKWACEQHGGYQRYARPIMDKI